ncbi:MAG: PorT family protein [Bacteroidales bacterium]|nr:PorT family protein [Bacteroidales bacterium]
MKKIALILTVMSVFCLTTNAQERVGRISIKPSKGLTISDISGWKYSGHAKRKTGYTEGVEAEFIVKPWLGVSVGAEYTQMGAKLYIRERFVKSIEHSEYMDEINPSLYEKAANSFRTLDGPVNNDYLTVPVLANFHIFKGFSIATGLQAGFLLSSKIGSSYEYDQFTETIWEDMMLDSIEYYSEISRKNFCKNFDLGIPVGISYEYRNVTLDARYYFGLMHTMKKSCDGLNRCLSITLGYKFDVR